MDLLLLGLVSGGCAAVVCVGIFAKRRLIGRDPSNQALRPVTRMDLWATAVVVGCPALALLAGYLFPDSGLGVVAGADPRSFLEGSVSIGAGLVIAYALIFPGKKDATGRERSRDRIALASGFLLVAAADVARRVVFPASTAWQLAAWFAPFLVIGMVSCAITAKTIRDGIRQRELPDPVADRAACVETVAARADRASSELLVVLDAAASLSVALMGGGLGLAAAVLIGLGAT